jgi:hypothetical protein
MIKSKLNNFRSMKNPEKDAKNRLQAIGDWRLLLDEQPPAALVATKRGVDRWVWPAVAAVVTLALAAVSLVHFREKAAAAPVPRFEIAGPGGQIFGTPVLSPDGSRLLFTVASGANGVRQLRVRPLDALEAHPLPGTEGARGIPFRSPDDAISGSSPPAS